MYKAKKVLLDREGAAKEFEDMFLESIPPEFLKEEVDRKIQNKITYDMEKLGQKHHRKLIHLSEQQGKPLYEMNSKAYKLVDLAVTPPDFVLNAITKGPRHPIRDKFDKMGFLAEMDTLVEHVESFTGQSGNITNEINIKACQYAKKMEGMTEDIEVNRMRKWLK